MAAHSTHAKGSGIMTPMFMQLLLVGTGGFFGAVGRWLLAGAVQRAAGASFFPWGTLAVNLLGGLALGLLMELVRPGWVTPQMRLLVGVGFLGGFTTFSTFMLESLRLVEEGEWLYAFGNLAGSVTAGLVLTWLGIVAGRALFT